MSFLVSAAYQTTSSVYQFCSSTVSSTVQYGKDTVGHYKTKSLQVATSAKNLVVKTAEKGIEKIKPMVPQFVADRAETVQRVAAKWYENPQEQAKETLPPFVYGTLEKGAHFALDTSKTITSTLDSTTKRVGAQYVTVKSAVLAPVHKTRSRVSESFLAIRHYLDQQLLILKNTITPIVDVRYKWALAQAKWVSDYSFATVKNAKDYAYSSAETAKQTVSSTVQSSQTFAKGQLQFLLSAVGFKQKAE
ncbi:hypothetical protein EDD86DRAFT_248421 [Gorgonomyces haynaldii]|nr:hypothetical protein EDD86DRAFT_248421 [Gorgonomyces haynaldii]